MSTFLQDLNIGGRTPMADQPSWLAHLRTEAASRLSEEGLPTAKTEAWQFTNLKPLLASAFQTTKADQALSEQCREWADSHLGEDECDRVYLINGRPLLSDGNLVGAPSSIEMSPLAQTLAQSPASIQPYLARHANSQYFSALNSALFDDGLIIRLPKNTKGSKALRVVHITDPGQSASSVYPRIVIIAGENSEFSLVETYLSKPGVAQLCTAVTEVCLEAGAKLDHLRIVEADDNSNHIATLAIHQKRDSRYLSRSVVMGGKLVRVQIDAHMAGPGAECKLEGVYHAVGSEHVAHHTTITHEDSHCSSTEEYRGLIDDRAHAVFDGIVVVNRGTKGTSAHQQNHNLLLSERATINTKPHLEIDSDDLTASHGATVGALDPEQLFFLRARGIDEEEARTILTFSFVRSILDRIDQPIVRERLLKRLIARLPYAGDASELV